MEMQTMEVNETKIEMQVCIIKIVFPAVSDDAAMEVKKKIADIMRPIPETNINFNLLAGRPPGPVQ